MSIVYYSAGRIEFVPNDRQRPGRVYSEKSLIELRKYGCNSYSLRAVDVENDKKEIFNIPLEQIIEYKHGTSSNQYDAMYIRSGTYRLWLNATTRTRFHGEFDTVFHTRNPSSPSLIFREEVYSDNDRSSSGSNVDHHTHTPATLSKDLLIDIHQLSQHIQQGNGNAAARIASQLAAKRIQLQMKSSREITAENSFTIDVQIDGNEYNLDHHGPRIPLNVFPSTAVRELRAVFETIYQYPSSGQYVFVNGDLVNDHSTMKELKVGPKSLFVLFVLSYVKQFERNGPWKCSCCGADNNQINHRCTRCSAARIQ